MERCKCRSDSSIIMSVAGGAFKTLPDINKAFLSPSESSAALYSGPPSLLAITRPFSRMLMVMGIFDCRSSSLIIVIGASFFEALVAAFVSPASTKSGNFPRADVF